MASDATREDGSLLGVAAPMARRIVSLLDTTGVDAATVLTRAGVRRAELDDPAARVPNRAVAALVELASRHIAPAELGARIAAVREPATYGAAGLAVVTARTVLDALARAVELQRAWGDGSRFRFGVHEQRATVSFRHPSAHRLTAAVLAECALLEVMDAVRVLGAQPSVRPERVELAHARLEGCSPLPAIFGVEPVFGASESRIVLSLAVLEREVTVPPEVVADLARTLARREVDRVAAPAGYAERVARLVSEALDPGPPSVDAIAGKLCMSVRTLQRRLGAEGTSFRQLVDEARQRRAEALVARGRTATEVAYSIGFADPSGLARARRRWSG